VIAAPPLSPASETPRHRSAVFVGLARDCAAYLPHVLDNIHLMAGFFAKAAFVFAENDSRDETAEILGVFAAGRPDCHILNFDGIPQSLPERTRRFAYLRNRCIAFIRADKRLRHYDYVIVMDMDDVNAAPLDPDAVVKAFAFLAARDDTAGVFANCRGTYYDMWTLREPRLCPGDVWEEQLDYVLAHQVDDMTAYKKTFEPRLFTLAETAPPLAVTSAFGGLAIYKLRDALPATYKGFKAKEAVQAGIKRHFRFQVCEHVAFNEDITRHGGKLYILPFLVNRITAGIEFSATAYRSLIF
jgi:glycosyltransferase involved in cell wall biosynthesis